MRWLIALAVGTLALAGAAGAQEAPPKLPRGGVPALACGQYPEGRAYWTEYGFCDIAVRGPEKAKGLVIWNHGLRGTSEQYGFAPPPVVRRLARAGWDVIKINRNNLYEADWSTTGTRHRDDLIERVKAARAQGYRAVIAAGQSYGGAIALEANAKAGGIDAVLALAPGHGSDVNADGASKAYPNLDRYLLEVAAAQKDGRVIVMVAAGDRLHPNRRGPASFIGPRLRQALVSSGRPFVLLDETMPITGHGAGATGQFDAWYGPCLQRFVDPARPERAGATTCSPPDPLPRFVLPDNLKKVVRGTEGVARLLGHWTGSYDGSDRPTTVIVEIVNEAYARIVYATGTDPAGSLGMGWERLAGSVQSGRISARRANGHVLTLHLAPDGNSLAMEHIDTAGRVARGTLQAAQ